MQRRHLLTIGTSGLALPALLRSGARAQGAASWPDRPVRIIVPYPPGGSNDTVARIIQPRLQDILGKPVIIDNRGGASGSVGASETARAAPDGYTWCLANDTLAANDTLLALPYKSAELTACCLLGTCPYALTVHPSLPYRTLADVIAAAKAQPGALNFATTGVGSLAHVATVLLQQQGGFKLEHVPYRGGGPALQDALAGHVPLFMSNIVIILPHIRAGALRPVGVSSPAESRYLPGVPSFTAQGFPGFEALTYWVLVGPAHVPEAVTQRLQQAIAQALGDAQVQARMGEQGADILALPPGRTAEFLAAETRKWGAVIRQAGITMEG